MRIRYRRLLVATLLAVGLSSGIQAQNLDSEQLEDFLQHLKDHALTLNITARIRGSEETNVWNMELSRVTISGRAVRVRLDGDNIKVDARFTPYRAGENSLLLLAEGTTWIRDGDERSESTSFQSLPLRLGESVFFYPLGDESVQMDIETDEGLLRLELEIQIVPYSDSTNN